MTRRTRGVHHFSLTVTDVKRSATFYEKVLGLKNFGGDERSQCLSDGVVLLCVQQAPHQPLANDRFNENRVGLDHIAFAVESHKELEDTLAALRELSVPTVGIELDPDGQGEYVCFRDPDNIQVEVYVMTPGEFEW